LKNRGVSIGTQPKDFTDFTDEIEIMRKRYLGTVTYSRELTAEELQEYEMELIYTCQTFVEW